MKTNLNDAIARLGIARDVTASEIHEGFQTAVPAVQAVSFELYKMLSVLLISCQQAKRLAIFRDQTALVLLLDEAEQMEKTAEYAEVVKLAQSGAINGNFLKRYQEAKALLEEIVND